MDKLEYLIEKDENLNNKIKKAVKSLKKWFEERLKKASDLLDRCKEKFSKKLSVKLPKGKLKKDIKYKGKTLFKKGDSSNKVFAKAKELCSEIINKIKEIINNCKAGLRELTNVKKAKSRKEKIMDTTEELTSLFGTVSTVLGCLSAAWVFSKDVMEAKEYYSKKDTKEEE